MKIVYVAVGLVFYQQTILIAQRHEHQHQGGLWEFPGGKIEAAENMQQALARELHEEVGLDVKPEKITRLMQIPHAYEDKKVLLSVGWVVIDEQQYNLVESKEAQPIKWVSEQELKHYKFPSANHSILLQLPALFKRVDELALAWQQNHITIV